MNKQSFEPYYKNLSENDAMNSGYFVPTHDKIDWEQHVNLPCTPINFLKQVTNTHNPAIIISTGAHCPLHDGHISIMKSAKDAVENAGYTVIGGYLSPGHDEYINEKLGDNGLNISRRMEWANNMLKADQSLSWIKLDPWEGVFAPGAVNFTSVVHRLQLYINKFYISANVKIFFACGDDNARFLIPFKNTEIGTIVVKRPGYEEIRNNFENNICINVIFTNNTINTSSTDIRKTYKYKKFKEDQQDIQAYARMHWCNDERQTLKILKKYYSHVWVQDYDDQVQDWKEQKTIALPIINLDEETDHGIKLNISREYDLFGQYKIGYTNRPGYDTINNQINKIVKDNNLTECYLFDDDIFTGNTMDYIQEKLRNTNNVSVKGRLSFISGSSDNHEVVDIKDFIFGYNKSSGLVTKIDGELVRVPYIYPFVDPSARASIKEPLSFSCEMWLNSMNYYQTDKTIISDRDDLLFLTKLGFKHTDTLYDVCAYYFIFLMRLQLFFN